MRSRPSRQEGRYPVLLSFRPFDPNIAKRSTIGSNSRCSETRSATVAPHPGTPESRYGSDEEVSGSRDRIAASSRFHSARGSPTESAPTPLSCAYTAIRGFPTSDTCDSPGLRHMRLSTRPTEGSFPTEEVRNLNALKTRERATQISERFDQHIHL